jgi:ketosteroid isomerase-like protein
MESNSKDVSEIISTVYAIFEAGKNKDLTSLSSYHLQDKSFSKFDEFPPYSRQDFEQAIVYEQAAFVNLSDYQYRIEDMKIDRIDDVAIVTFYLDYSGVFVNDYSFEGRSVHSRSRVTMVLFKTQEGWKVVHEHFSSFPDWPKYQKGGA